MTAIAGGASTPEAIVEVAQREPTMSGGISGIGQKIGGAFMPDEGRLAQGIQQMILSSKLQEAFSPAEKFEQRDDPKYGYIQKSTTTGKERIIARPGKSPVPFGVSEEQFAEFQRKKYSTTEETDWNAEADKFPKGSPANKLALQYAAGKTFGGPASEKFITGSKDDDDLQTQIIDIPTKTGTQKVLINKKTGETLKSFGEEELDYETQVIEVTGKDGKSKKVLINKETGETIKDLGISDTGTRPTEPTKVENDRNRDIKILTDTDKKGFLKSPSVQQDAARKRLRKNPSLQDIPEGEYDWSDQLEGLPKKKIGKLDKAYGKEAYTTALQKIKDAALSQGYTEESAVTDFNKWWDNMATSKDPQGFGQFVVPRMEFQEVQLDEAMATRLLQEAGGDKEQARKLAKERGYKF
jgi:hypothetical protein